ncbi:hypothetical protein G5I_01559 [Acromyrmex echinatior]|uniref:Uncharacterized protein n=1 Tax=Acromyrmex echinatior TaxID=103372 RepID=F4W7Y2_ACREC|nr:hypothetical protein G5I_01559 [Acromyrmex echinatior]
METCYNKRSGKFDVGCLPKILLQVEYLTSFPSGTFAAKPFAEIRMQDHDIEREKSATTGVNSNATENSLANSRDATSVLSVFLQPNARYDDDDDGDGDDDSDDDDDDGTHSRCIMQQSRSRFRATRGARLWLNGNHANVNPAARWLRMAHPNFWILQRSLCVCNDQWSQGRSHGIESCFNAAFESATLFVRLPSDDYSESRYSKIREGVAVRAISSSRSPCRYSVSGAITVSIRGGHNGDSR